MLNIVFLFLFSMCKVTATLWDMQIYWAELSATSTPFETERGELQAFRKQKKHPRKDAFCGAYEIRTRDLLRDRQAF